MRAAPAIQVSLRRFGAWRGAVCTLTALGLAALAAWTSQLELPAAAPWLLTVAFAVPLVLAIAVALTRIPATELRWDGRCWHLGAASGEPVAGELRVEIDLGPWMLLRFTPADPAERPRRCWLPVQRAGLEAQWHALRCAVHAPRPPARDAETDGS